MWSVDYSRTISHAETLHCCMSEHQHVALAPDFDRRVQHLHHNRGVDISLIWADEVKFRKPRWSVFGVDRAARLSSMRSLVLEIKCQGKNCVWVPGFYKSVGVWNWQYVKSFGWSGASGLILLVHLEWILLPSHLSLLWWIIRESLDFVLIILGMFCLLDMLLDSGFD